MAVGEGACWLARTYHTVCIKVEDYLIQGLAYSGNNATNRRGIPGRF